MDTGSCPLLLCGSTLALTIGVVAGTALALGGSLKRVRRVKRMPLGAVSLSGVGLAAQ